MAGTASGTRKVPSGLVPKPRLSVWQIFTMSFGFLGIQFGFALQNGNTSRILRSFGADVDQFAIVLACCAFSRNDSATHHWPLQR